jgi:hypothetical protein
MPTLAQSESGAQARRSPRVLLKTAILNPTRRVPNVDSKLVWIGLDDVTGMHKLGVAIR